MAANTIDEIIAKTIENEVEKAIKVQFKILTPTLIETIKNIINNSEEEYKEKFITAKEAGKRLKLNPRDVKKLLDEGIIKTVVSPNGRRKVNEASLNAYING